MTGTRLILPVVVVLVAVPPVDAASIFGRKAKTEAQVKRLIDGLRTEPDEKKRRAAVAELREADPRTHLDVIPALVTVLQRDPAPQVRADAAEAIGQFKLVFGLAGTALEAAAASDPSRLVRDSAQQALWEYHLSGYRSSRGAGGIAGQTVEPPVARPALPRRSVEVVPVAVAPQPVSATAPVPPPTKPTVGRPHPVAPPALPAPQPVHTDLGPGPLPDPADLAPVAISVPPRVLLTVAPPSAESMTDEPPVAPPPVLPVAPAPTPLFATGENTTDGRCVPSAEPPPELVDLPPVSLPPTADLPSPAASANEYGPRVESPAARVLTGSWRFKSPE